jgi:uncharacterized protein
MRIDNSFTVSVPVDRAWEVLTDLEGVSLCLPGARVTGVEGEVYSGEVRVKVGPVVSQYAGTAQFVEKDDAHHRAVIDAKGRDSRGAGNASALITMQLTADGDHTVATVDTDMKISGKIAQLGGGMIKDVSVKLLGQFVECLEAKFATSEPSTEPVATATSAQPATAPTSEQPATVSVTPESAAPAPPENPAVAAPSGEPVTTPSATRAEPPLGGREGGRPTGAAQAPPSRQSTPSEAAEPLDLMALAGGTMAKRVLPVLLGVLAVVAIVVYLIVR